MVDPISDMLTRIRNASLVQKPQVEVPFSKIKYEISKILVKEGFIKEVELKARRARKELILTLRYEDKVPVITGLRRISKPGQRIYMGSLDLKKVRGGFGFSIVSTSQGIMTGYEARKQQVGGEVICEIW